MSKLDTMQPGPALDALVAEQVMANVWKHPANCDGWMQCCTPTYPRYSTSIAAAWEVVEKMRTDPRWGGCKACVGIEVHGHEGHDGMNFWAHIHGEDAEAPTAPHAICLAALKAVGYGIEQDYSINPADDPSVPLPC